jgi:hypothetical protein
VLNHEYVASYLSADTSWYNDHLADDFVCIESDGSVLDKSAFLAARAKGPDFDAYGTTETSLRVYGDTALVQDRDTATRHDGSKRTSRSTSVWMRRGGLWKAVSVQMTPCSQ